MNLVGVIVKPKFLKDKTDIVLDLLPSLRTSKKAYQVRHLSDHKL